jgi:hypothetical protein
MCHKILLGTEMEHNKTEECAQYHMQLSSTGPEHRGAHTKPVQTISTSVLEFTTVML